MGNCFGFLKEYNAKPIYNSNSIPVSSVPIGTPIYFDTSNNHYTQNSYNSYNSYNPQNLYNPYNAYNPQNPQNPNVIVLNQHPYYYDNGLSTMNGFFTGMLMGEILSDDCL